LPDVLHFALREAAVRGCLKSQKEELQPQMDADGREFEDGSHASIHKASGS
jgi:hypothetical protein